MASAPFGSFLLIGDVAQGKTHLLMAQYRAQIDARRFDNQIVTDVTLARWMRQSVLDPTSKPPLSLEELQERRTFWLGLDDLGKAKASAFMRTTLFELVNLCYTQQFGLTVTSNLGLEQLMHWIDGQGEEYTGHGAGVVRRLEDMCTVIDLFPER